MTPIIAAVLLGGVHWQCVSQNDVSEQKYYDCWSEKGDGYISREPLSEQSLSRYRASEAREIEQARCACSRQLYDGAPSGTNIICTGAFSPYVLRQSKQDPCKGSWE